jgi:hypothetical protein
MAKKSVSAPAPEMSTLPIKQDDSPIVIDLPDGQKLVVGQLANGSVIEVATWRGTGRPDSRTSRLMLGMSSASGAQSPAAEDEAAKPGTKPDALSVLKTLIKKSIDGLRRLPIRQVLAIVKRRSPKKSAQPFIKTVANENLAKESDEVEDWLNKIMAKSEKRVQSEKIEIKKTEVKKSDKKAPAKKAVAKKAVAKKAVAKKAKGGAR